MISSTRSSAVEDTFFEATLLEEGAHKPTGPMWFPPEFYEYFTLEQGA